MLPCPVTEPNRLWRAAAPLVRVDLDRQSDRLLALLLGTDILLIAVHLLNRHSPVFSRTDFSITADGGFAEVFQYVKELWIASMLVALAVRAWRSARSRASCAVYLAWAALFAYLLADDLFQVHERVGESMAARAGFEGMIGLRAGDLGQLLVTAFAAVVLLGGVFLGHRWADRTGRAMSASLFVLVLALGGFGVVADTIHALVSSLPVLDSVLGVLEDGGEMVIMSLAVRLAFGAWTEPGQEPGAGRGRAGVGSGVDTA